MKIKITDENVLVRGDGWVIFGDEENPSLYIDNNELREECIDVSILHNTCYWYPDDHDGKEPTPRQKARLDRMATIALSSAWNYVCDPECQDSVEDFISEASPAIVSLIEELRKRKTSSETRCAEALRKGGALAFDEMVSGLHQGMQLIFGEEELRHGAEIENVNIYENMTGRYALVSMRFLTHDGKSFRIANIRHAIFQFSGKRTLVDIGLRIMTDDDKEYLLNRFNKWKALVEKPSHVQIDGFLTRKSWVKGGRYHATGRAMIDIKGMSRMDSDYRDFYGELCEKPDDRDTGGLSLISANQLYSSPYVYGFSFGCKLWGEFKVTDLSPATYQSNALDLLVMDSKRKKMISAIVEQACDPSAKFSDFIDGKGGGAVFLLHGSPGVGKTLTAEAVAERLARPLYMIGAGELGSTPDQIESVLSDILEVSSAWNAVLLIDECDVFLERRQASDIKRNAMVGIFLRLLEYYQGVLFLTTNRIGEIDQAFLSRISLGLHYKPLNQEERAMVWKGIAERNKLELADSDFRSLARHDINGRQIKHAVRLALALSRSEKRPVSCEDLESMVELSESFIRDFETAREDEKRDPSALEK